MVSRGAKNTYVAHQAIRHSRNTSPKARQELLELLGWLSEIKNTAYEKMKLGISRNQNLAKFYHRVLSNIQ